MPNLVPCLLKSYLETQSFCHVQFKGGGGGNSSSFSEI